MTRIVVLVSGGGTNLQALIDAQTSNALGGGKIVAVISSKPDVYALKRAELANIQTLVLQRSQYSDIAAYSTAMRDALISLEADLVVYAGFMTILDERVTSAFQNRMINVHPALIPAFCGKGYYGLRVHEEVLKRGVKVTGATVHFVNEICDGGPIILQAPVSVHDDDTPEVLQKRVMSQAEWKILPEAVRLICEGCVSVRDGRTYIANKEKNHE